MKKKIAFLLAVIFIIAIILNLPRLKLVNRYYLNPCYYDKPVKQQDFPQHFIEVDIEDYYTQVLELSNSLLEVDTCLLYTSPSPRDRTRSRMPSSA